MRGIIRVIVVMVFISLAAYGLHLVAYKPKHGVHPNLAPPRVTAQQAAHATSAAGPEVASADGRLIYPGPAARRALHLGYAVFDVRTDGSMMAVPLPPGSTWQTMLALDTVGHRRLVMQPMSSHCNFDVALALYRTDHPAPVWRGELPGHNGAAKKVVDLAAIGASNPLLVSLKMADGAKNNWSCNVILSWDDARQTQP